jgi:hypothetical protein
MTIIGAQEVEARKTAAVLIIVKQELANVGVMMIAYPFIYMIISM